MRTKDWKMTCQTPCTCTFVLPMAVIVVLRPVALEVGEIKDWFA